MNEDLVERAARAMYELRPAYMGSGPNAERWTWEKASPDSKDYCRDNARAAIAAMPGWKPIASAPRDETAVILYCPGTEFGAVIGFWSVVHSGWYDSEAASHAVSVLYGDPTHWAPCPICPPSPIRLQPRATETTMVDRTNLPATTTPDRELVKEIAMDIGKEAVSHLRIMYPAAFAALGKSGQLSLRNSVHNEILAALG